MGVPAPTPVGSVPKPSSTLSPLSEPSEPVAWSVKVLLVSPLLKVTLAGTPL